MGLGGIVIYQPIEIIYEFSKREGEPLFFLEKMV